MQQFTNSGGILVQQQQPIQQSQHRKSARGLERYGGAGSNNGVGKTTSYSKQRAQKNQPPLAQPMHGMQM